MTYQIADGFDQTGSLADVLVQPRCEGIIYPDRIVALDDTEYDDGYGLTKWEYSMLTSDQFNALLAQFGLSSTVLTNDVTISTRIDDRTFANYNGKIVLPINGKERKYRRGFWRDVTFRIKQLEAIL